VNETNPWDCVDPREGSILRKYPSEISLVIFSFITFNLQTVMCLEAESPLIFVMVTLLPICCCGQANKGHLQTFWGKKAKFLPMQSRAASSSRATGRDKLTANHFSWATRSVRGQERRKWDDQRLTLSVLPEAS